jgi:hypothetical protein
MPISQNLDDAAQKRLIEALASKPSRPAQDDEAAPSFDPNDERFGPNGTLQRKKQLNGAQDAKRRRIAQDARWTRTLKAAFRPGGHGQGARGQTRDGCRGCQHAGDAARS